MSTPFKDPIDAAQLQQVWERVQSSRARHANRGLTRTLVFGASAVAATCAAVVVYLALAGNGPIQTFQGAAFEGVAPSQTAHLSDGSTLTSQGALLAVVENSGSTIRLQMTTGVAHFDIKPNGPRRWFIETNLGVVQVVGTRFALDLTDERLQVAVERGRVILVSEHLEGGARALGPQQTATARIHRVAANDSPGSAVHSVSPALRPTPKVAANDSPGSAVHSVSPALRPTPKVAANDSPGSVVHSVSPALRPTPKVAANDSPGSAVHSASPALRPTPKVRRRRSARAPARTTPPGSAARVASSAPRPNWTVEAERGDHHQAWNTLGAAGHTQASRKASTVDSLLDLADVARLSGHSQQAVLPLREIIARFPADPRAALAAFALGRLQIDRLKQPAAAAGSFQRAIALGAPATIAEDAFARCVEAHSRAGQLTAAKAVAKAYNTRFPDGRRSSDIQRWLRD